jgi:hypothetical protein
MTNRREITGLVGFANKVSWGKIFEHPYRRPISGWPHGQNPKLQKHKSSKTSQTPLGLEL